MPNRDEVLRDETYKGQFETVGERVYATLMNAKRMGPQLTAKTVALIVQISTSTSSCPSLMESVM